MVEWQASAFVLRDGQECRKPNTTTKADFLPLHFGEDIVGYEEKDIGDDGAPFYIGCGVLDVLVVDPRSGLIRHYRPQEAEPSLLHTPTAVALACGCGVRLD
jgi:hypothetical protein